MAKNEVAEITQDILQRVEREIKKVVKRKKLEQSDYERITDLIEIRDTARMIGDTDENNLSGLLLGHVIRLLINCKIE